MCLEKIIERFFVISILAIRSGNMARTGVAMNHVGFWRLDLLWINTRWSLQLLQNATERGVVSSRSQRQVAKLQAIPCRCTTPQYRETDSLSLACHSGPGRTSDRRARARTSRMARPFSCSNKASSPATVSAMRACIRSTTGFWSTKPRIAVKCSADRAVSLSSASVDGRVQRWKKAGATCGEGYYHLRSRYQPRPPARRTVGIWVAMDTIA